MRDFDPEIDDPWTQYVNTFHSNIFFHNKQLHNDPPFLNNVIIIQANAMIREMNNK